MPAASLPFDFLSYLRQIDPSQDYEIDTLDGGSVNFTVRARKLDIKNVDTDTLAGRFRRKTSLVLKYAAPYIASIGEEAPLGLERQTTEAIALALFTFNGPLFSVPSVSGVQVPQILHHDLSAHALVMSDLGPWKPLSTILSPSRRSPVPSEYALNTATATSIGLRLGKFFSTLHSSRTAKLVGRAGFPATATDRTIVGSRTSVVFEHSVKPIHGCLLDHGDGITEEEAKKLFSRVQTAFDDQGKSSKSLSFTIGDAWLNSILLGSWTEAPISPNDPVPGVGVIDYEFASLSEGDGVQTDIAQLLAGLHLALIQAETQGNEDLSGSITQLLGAFTTAYRLYRGKGMAKVSSVDEEGEETEMTAEVSDDAWPLVDISAGAVQGLAEEVEAGAKERIVKGALDVARAAFISHGREIIKNAVEREWSTDDDATGLRKKMVMAGVQYLRAAGDNVEEFKTELPKLFSGGREGIEGGILKGLFVGRDAESLNNTS